MIEQRTQFENAISELKDLLAQDSNNESKFQNWFENHPIVMSSLHYKENIPHPNLKAFNGELFIPDFIVQLLNNTWEIFELKLPFEKLLKSKERRNTFYAKIYEYCQQCIEYSEFFYDNTNRLNFELEHGFNIPFPPRSTLIVGRDNGIDRFKLNKQLDQFTNRINIITFDDILRQLEFDRLKVLGDYENIQGLSVLLVANIKNSGRLNYLFSCGSKGDENNISIYVNTQNQICYKLIDKKGKILEGSIDNQASKFEFGKSMYFLFEFGFGADYTVCSSEVNGNYGSVIRTSKMEFDYNDLIKNTVIGTNYDGKQNSNFDLYGFVSWPNTFSLENRLILRNEVIDKFLNNKEIPDAQIIFYDNRFLYKNSNQNFTKNNDCTINDFVQTNKDNQPGLITKGVKKGELFVPVIYNQSK